MDPLRRGDGRSSFFVECKPPLLKLGQQQALSLEKRVELGSRELLRLSEDADLLVDRPRLRFVPSRGHERQATCITQPPRQSLLRDARLARKRPRAHSILPRQLLDHLLLERQRERLRHAAIASSPHSMTRVKRQLRCHWGVTQISVVRTPSHAPRPLRETPQPLGLSLLRRVGIPISSDLVCARRQPCRDAGHLLEGCRRDPRLLAGAGMAP